MSQGGSDAAAVGGWLRGPLIPAFSLEGRRGRTGLRGWMCSHPLPRAGTQERELRTFSFVGWTYYPLIPAFSLGGRRGGTGLRGWMCSRHLPSPPSRLGAGEGARMPIKTRAGCGHSGLMTRKAPGGMPASSAR